MDIVTSHKPTSSTMHLEVSCTCPSRDHADKLATLLIEAHLAACVQISGPVSSMYRWQGKIETDTEWLCKIKSTSARYDELEKAILANHPYDNPEIIAHEIKAGSREYLAWLEAETKS